MSKTLKNIGCRAGFLILILCTLILAASIQGATANAIAQTMQPLSGNPVITQTEPLFMLDGTSNSELINQLVYLSENADRVAPNLQGGHTVSGISVSDANNIREFNGGQLPDILLFEPHGYFSATGMTVGTVNDQSRDNFTHSRWRLVYITHPDNGDDPVFTFKMIEAFRGNRMHPVSTNWVNDIRYENSELRFNLIEEFNNVLELFPNPSDLRSNFIAPVDVPGGWQSAQPDLGSVNNQSLESGAINDLIWLPSAYEVAGSSAGNQDLWRLTREERAHVNNGFGNWSWLRSGHISSSEDRSRMIEAVGTELRNDSDIVTISRAVAPALHLSFSNYASVIADFSDESSRAATVQTGQESPVSQTRFSIERYDGEQTVVFNASEFNTVQNLTIRSGLNSITLTPTDTPTEHIESFGTFEIWYTNDGRVVHVNISNVSQTFSIRAHTTNNWEITRVYGWPTGFGLSASPPNSTVIAENSFLAATAVPSVLPNGHRFNGWWTNNGAGSNWGVLVDNNTVVANVGNIETVEHIETLYAMWIANTATVERVHYGNSIENIGPQVVWLAGAVMEPILSSHLPADENLVFGGWWSQDGTGGEWGQRVTANTFITEAQNGTTIQIFARWQLYVPRPVLDEINLSTRRISWESSISGATFVVSINGGVYEEQSEDYFDFSQFASGTHTISIRTASAGYESDALFVTIVIPHTPTFNEVWTGYTGTRPVIGGTRIDGEYTYEMVRWDSVVTTAANGDVTLTHTAVWVRVEAIGPTEVVAVHFVDSRGTGGFGTETRTVVDLEDDIISPDWARQGYILSWETTVEDGVMTFMAVWTPQNQGGYELDNFEMNAISWIFLGSAISLAVAFVLVSILAAKRRRKI